MFSCAGQGLQWQSAAIVHIVTRSLAICGQDFCDHFSPERAIFGMESIATILAKCGILPVLINPGEI